MRNINNYKGGVDHGSGSTANSEIIVLLGRVDILCMFDCPLIRYFVSFQVGL